MIPNTIFKCFNSYIFNRAAPSFSQASKAISPSIFKRSVELYNPLQVSGLKTLSSVKTEEFKVTYASEGKIAPKDLDDLLKGRKDALVVEGFLKGDALENNQRISSGYNPAITCLDTTFCYFGFKKEEFLQPKEKEAYYDSTAGKSLEAYRDLASPGVTWIDQLIGQLNIAHEKGALHYRENGKIQGSFITRGYSSLSTQDKVLRTIPTAVKVDRFSRILSCHLFLLAPALSGSIGIYAPLNEKACLNYSKRLEKGEILPQAEPRQIETIKAFAGRLLICDAKFPYKLYVEDTKIEGKVKKDKSCILEVKKQLPLVLGETYLLYKEGDPIQLLR